MCTWEGSGKCTGDLVDNGGHLSRLYISSALAILVFIVKKTYPHDLQIVIINSMEQETQGFNNDQNSHQIMNFEYGLLTLLQKEEPKASRHEE